MRNINLSPMILLRFYRYILSEQFQYIAVEYTDCFSAEE